MRSNISKEYRSPSDLLSDMINLAKAPQVEVKVDFSDKENLKIRLSKEDEVLEPAIALDSDSLRENFESTIGEILKNKELTEISETLLLIVGYEKGRSLVIDVQSNRDQKLNELVFRETSKAGLSKTPQTYRPRFYRFASAEEKMKCFPKVGEMRDWVPELMSLIGKNYGKRLPISDELVKETILRHMVRKAEVDGDKITEDLVTFEKYLRFCSPQEEGDHNLFFQLHHAVSRANKTGLRSAILDDRAATIARYLREYWSSYDKRHEERVSRNLNELKEKKFLIDEITEQVCFHIVDGIDKNLEHRYFLKNIASLKHEIAKPLKEKVKERCKVALSNKINTKRSNILNPEMSHALDLMNFLIEYINVGIISYEYLNYLLLDEEQLHWFVKIITNTSEQKTVKQNLEKIVRKVDSRECSTFVDKLTSKIESVIESRKAVNEKIELAGISSECNGDLSENSSLRVPLESQMEPKQVSEEKKGSESELDNSKSEGEVSDISDQQEDNVVVPSTKNYEHRHKLGQFAYGMFSPRNIIKNVINDVAWNATTTQRRDTRDSRPR